MREKLFALSLGFVALILVTQSHAGANALQSGLTCPCGIAAVQNLASCNFCR